MRRAIKDLDSDATEEEGNDGATQTGVVPQSMFCATAQPELELIYYVGPLLTQSTVGHARTRSLSRQVSMESIGSTCTCELKDSIVR